MHSLWALIEFIASFSNAESLLMICGLIFAIIAGGGQPVEGVSPAKSAVALSCPPPDHPKSGLT
jgi:ATP-binding cassette subfamily B (MDR/TAP) protein 1